MIEFYEVTGNCNTFIFACLNLFYLIPGCEGQYTLDQQYELEINRITSLLNTY